MRAGIKHNGGSRSEPQDFADPNVGVLGRRGQTRRQQAHRDRAVFNAAANACIAPNRLTQKDFNHFVQDWLAEADAERPPNLGGRNPRRGSLGDQRNRRPRHTSGLERFDVIDVVEGHVIAQVGDLLGELLRLREVIVPHRLRV
jgi:hypothetical protein